MAEKKRIWTKVMAFLMAVPGCTKTVESVKEQVEGYSKNVDKKSL